LLSGTSTIGTQTINFTAPASPVNYNVAPITLSATATSGLAVTFSVISGPGQIFGDTLTITGAGPVLVAADQTGDGNYTAATQVQHTIVVNQQTPGIGLASDSNPVLTMNNVNLTATLTWTGSTAPTGSVIFYNGATSLGSAPLNGAGVAVLGPLTTLPIGTDSLTAYYAGDTNFLNNTSAPLAEVVNDFSLGDPAAPGGSVSTPTLLSEPGGVAIYSFTATPTGATFGQDITLSVSGLPAGAVAVFNPPTLLAAWGVTPVTLTITLPQTAELTYPQFGHPNGGSGTTIARNAPQSAIGIGRKFAPFALALLLLPFAGRMRKTRKRLTRWMSILLLFAAFGATTLLSGCSSITGDLSPSYNVTITATAGHLTRTTNFILKLK
jgi:hypothetical protein